MSRKCQVCKKEINPKNTYKIVIYGAGHLVVCKDCYVQHHTQPITLKLIEEHKQKAIEEEERKQRKMLEDAIRKVQGEQKVLTNTVYRDSPVNNSGLSAGLLGFSLGLML